MQGSRQLYARFSCRSPLEMSLQHARQLWRGYGKSGQTCVTFGRHHVLVTAPGGRMTLKPLLATDEIIHAARAIIAHAQEQTEALLKLMGPSPRDDVSRCVIRIGMTSIRADADRKLAEALDRIELGRR